MKTEIRKSEDNEVYKPGSLWINEDNGELYVLVQIPTIHLNVKNMVVGDIPDYGYIAASLSDGFAWMLPATSANGAVRGLELFAEVAVVSN